MTIPATQPKRNLAGFLQSIRGRDWLSGLLLVAAVMLAYQPVWHAGFIWDDDDYIIKNKLLAAPDGLRWIWLKVGATPQYYPLVYSLFRAEYHLWGLNPLGYHLVNVLLHALGAILLWNVLSRLKLPGAWLVAAVWALHPVCVESVAWITERKNVLSAVFYFSATLAYLKFTQDRQARDGPVGHSKAGPGETSVRVRDSRRSNPWPWYFAALILFTAGLFSKTVVCSLPATLLLVVWWKQGRLRRGEVLPLVPFFIVGAGLGLLTAYVEKHHVGAEGTDWALTATQRCLIASRAPWFYAGKLAWPADLTFSYPRWEASGTVWWQWLFPLATVGVIAALWLFRNRIGRGPLVAVLVFIGTLFPALGFVNLYPMRYTFVADHYQYLACISLLALVGAGAFRMLAAGKGRWSWAKPVFCGALLLTLGGLTWRQCGMYDNLETLWRTTIARNPASWMARFNLGSTLLGRGQVDDAINYYNQTLEIKPDYAPACHGLGIALSQKGSVDAAIAQYRHALQISPDYADAHNDLGNALFQKGNVDEAMLHYQESLRINPRNAEAHNNLAIGLIQKGRMNEAITHFKLALQINPDNAEAQNNLGYLLLQNGQLEEAIARYQQALKIKPGYPKAQNNLAWVLATARPASLRNGNQAVALAQSANRLTGDGNPAFLRTLAAAYAEAGRFPEAVETAQRALQLAVMQANNSLVSALRSDMDLYQAGRPFPQH